MAWTERYVRADAAGGGDGTTDANSGANGAWTLAEAVTNAAAGMRLNVRAGTYANTTTSRTFSAAGTTTAPIWLRGFKTTAGDMDGVPSSTRVAGTDIPSFTFTTGGLTFSGAHWIVSNLDVLGARTAGPQLSLTGGNFRGHRLRVENTGTNAASAAIGSAGGTAYQLYACWFKATGSATRVFDNQRGASLRGCVFTGGGIGMDLTATAGGTTAAWCVFDTTGSHGINCANAAHMFLIADNCTFVGCGGDGVRLTATPVYGLVADSLFSGCGGYGINNASGADTNVVHRCNNDFHNNTSGTEAGFGDSPTFNDQTESSSPFVSGTDRGLVSGANAKANGLPGLFENQSYTNYLDIGAVQREEPAGGGGGGVNRAALPSGVSALG